MTTIEEQPHPPSLRLEETALRAAVGRWITRSRRRSGLSQSQLAQQLGVSRQRLGHWERGDHAPRLGDFLGLCATLSFGVDSLLAELGSPEEGK